MSIPAAPPGFTRLLMKSAFGAGRDFRVLDPVSEEQVYLVDGKLGPRPQADVLDASGTKRYGVRGQMFGIPKKMAIADASGAEVARIKARKFTLVRDKMDMEMASGDPWHVEGSLMEKNYTVTSGGRDVVRITQKWVTVRDAYTVDVADGVDVGLALAVVWAIDRWVERD